MAREKYNYEFRVAIKPCEVCAKPLKLINNRDLQRKRFCSFQCKTQGQIGKESLRYTKTSFTEARKCENCGIDYIANDPLRKYCTKKCLSDVLSRRSYSRHNDLRSQIKRLLTYKGRKQLSIDYILEMYERQRGLCALSGIPMTWNTLAGRVHTNLSIDRISSYIGYEIGNVQLVCRIVNIMKHNLGQLEFIELCRKIGGYSNSQSKS